MTESPVLEFLIHPAVLEEAESPRVIVVA